MLKSERFEVGLLDKYHLYIPQHIFEPFAAAGHSRVKVQAFYKDAMLELYAAVSKDKNTDDYVIMFSKRYQKALGVYQNDYFELQLLEDTSKYGVEMPEELEAVLMSDAEAYAIFEGFTAGKQRSIIYTIIRVKNPQLRVDRALLLCENLKRGVTDPMLLFKG